MLKFGKANAKHRKLTEDDFKRIADKYPHIFGSVVPTIKDFYTFSLPSGWSCPGALECLAKANRETGKVTDGEQTVYRCYQASLEAIYKGLRQSAWHNFDALRNKPTLEMFQLLSRSIPSSARIVRVHVGGDFFSPNYMRAWFDVAASKPNVLFYAYTKSIKILNQLMSEAVKIPKNFILTVSEGGRYDSERPKGLRTAKVVRHDDGQLDHNDSHAILPGDSFSLLIHGTQPRRA